MKFYHEIREEDNKHFFYVMIDQIELMNVKYKTFTDTIMSRLATRIARYIFKQNRENIHEFIDIEKLHECLAKELIEQHRIRVSIGDKK